MRTLLVFAMRGFALARSRQDLLSHFVAGGWRVVAACEDDPSADRLRDAGVDVRNLPFFSGARGPAGLLRLAAGMRRLLGELGPELVQTYNALPLILSGPAAAGRRPPVWVATVTGLGRGYGAGGLRRGLTLAGYGAGLLPASWTVCQNRDDHRVLCRRFPALASRSSVIVGSGVDTACFRPQASRPEGPVRVLMVSRLLWQKGVAEFAQLAGRLRRERPDVEFCLAGEIVPGDPDAVPESWLREQEAAGAFTWLGYREDLEDLLPTVAVLVHPTRYREGVPRIVLEAGACGVPVVAGRGPGTEDVVEDGVTGLLVPPGDAGALRGAVASLLADPRRAAGLGEAAARHVAEHHDVRQVTGAYLDLYARLGVAVP